MRAAGCLVAAAPYTIRTEFFVHTRIGEYNVSSGRETRVAFSEAEVQVLGRFREKCRIAGGPRAGYNLRRESILFELEGPAASDQGLADLVEKGLLVGNEAGDRFILTEEGVAALDPDRHEQVG